MNNETRTQVVEGLTLMKEVCTRVSCRFFRGFVASFVLAVVFGVTANEVGKRGEF